jgi:hypothetical protein
VQAHQAVGQFSSNFARRWDSEEWAVARFLGFEERVEQGKLASLKQMPNRALDSLGLP